VPAQRGAMCFCNASVAVPQPPVQVTTKWPLAPRQSCLSANDKDDDEVKLGALQISPGTYLTVEENSGKPLINDS
jgi:hypothetical protein